VVITVAFIGYLVAGPLGACAAAIGVFVPVYLVVIVVARWFHRLAKNRSLRAMIDGITAAATGAIAGAVFVLGRRGITDVATCSIFITTLALVLWAKRISEPLLILSAGIVGVLLQAL
jgi:chromate transporter